MSHSDPLPRFYLGGGLFSKITIHILLINKYHQNIRCQYISGRSGKPLFEYGPEADRADIGTNQNVLHITINTNNYDRMTFFFCASDTRIRLIN